MSFDLKIKNGDLSVKNGDLDIVRGTEKLQQDVLKVAMTPVNANPISPWYGSYISKTLIGNYLDSDFVISTAQTQLQNAIEILRNLQIKQATQTFQKVSPDELIAAVNDISVNRNDIDPRLFDVIIKIVSKSFKRVDAAFNVKSF
jgi:hypothetical protein